MKLTYFDFIHNLGGAQIANIKLLRNFDCEGGGKAEVISVFGGVDNFFNYAKQNNIPYYSLLNTKPLPFRKSFGVLYNYLLLILKAFSYFKKGNQEIVFTSSEKGLYILTAVKLLANKRIKVVYYSHGYDRLYKRKNLFYFICKKNVSAVWVLSENFKDIFIKHGINPEKIYIIPNYVDIGTLDCPDDFQIDENAVNILLPGSVIKAKGITESIESIKILTDENHSVHLYIAGSIVDEKYLTEVSQYIEHNNLKNYISILGWRRDILCIMKKMTLVLLPSYSEGMPLVILEAMALGKMSICSNVGSLPNIIINRETGLLLPSVSPENIANAIKEALQNNCFEKMAQNAATFVNNTYNRSSQKMKVVNALNALG